MMTLISTFSLFLYLTSIARTLLWQEGRAIAIPNVGIQIDTNTTITTDAQGIFNVVLPPKMQKEQYRLRFSKSG